MSSALGEPNAIAIAFFVIFIVLSLGITVWASRKTRTAEQFYAAGRSVTAFQNGLALAGDYMSAASFLGIAGLVAMSGFDGLIYSIGWLVGWPIVMFLIAEPLRNLGRYTFADVVATRLRQTPIRIAAAIGSLAVIAFYLIAQMVGAGNLIRLLFGLPYEVAVVIVGVVMLAYVLFGGMIATTWVQIVKAVLLLGGATLLALMVLARFGFNPLALFATGVDDVRSRRSGSRPAGDRSDRRHVAGAGADARNRGPAAHPDAVLHRARCADGSDVGRLCDRRSSASSTCSRSCSASARWCSSVVTPSPGSMPAATWRRRCWPRRSAARRSWASSRPLRSRRSWRSSPVSPCLVRRRCRTTSGSTSCVARKRDQREQLLVARVATVVLAIVSIVLGITFKGQNVAYMVGLAFAIAASANFPALVLSIFWKRLTTAGAQSSMIVGTVARSVADLSLTDDSDRHPAQRRRLVPASESRDRDRSRCRSSSRLACRCCGRSPRRSVASPSSNGNCTSGLRVSTRSP